MNPLSVAKTLLKNPLGTKQPQSDYEDDDEDDSEDGDEAKVTPKIDLIQLLHDDNKHVAELFFQYSQAEEDDEKQELFERIKLGMRVHAQLAEEMYYPLLPESVEEDEKEDAEKLVFEAEAGNYVASMIIDVLSTMQPSDDYFDGKMTILCELAKLQKDREEKEIFDKLKAAETEVDFEEVGINAAERKMELEEEMASAGKRAKKSAKASSRKASSAKGKTTAKGKSGSGAKTKPAAKAKTGAKSRAGAKTKAGAKPKASTKGSTKAKSGSKTKASSKSSAKPERAASKSAKKKPVAKKATKRSR